MDTLLSRRVFLAAATAAAASGTEALAGEVPPPGGTAPINAIREEPRETPVAAEADLCVVGGSCTGVFAAVAAARLGARVALIEANGFFGGVATASLVNVWHSTHDTTGKQPIIAGLTGEVIERLRRRRAAVAHGTASVGYVLNTEELKIELDELVTEARVRPFLHALFVAPIVRDGRLDAVAIEDKSGRRAIRAAYFVDATGDADVVARLGLPTYRHENIQPPTMCAILRDLREIARRHPGFNVHQAVFDPRYPNALRRGFSWGANVPGSRDDYMLAGTRVFGADCSDADQLTQAEIEGRRQVRAVCDILREHFLPPEVGPLVALPAKIGIRESRHARCLHTLTEQELLRGTRFPDAIANGSYRVDIHNASGAGVTFRDLRDTTFYQIPYRSLVPQGARNLLIAGRCIDADVGAFGAVRVMVNCNQMGQAAGVAAYVALQSRTAVSEVEPARLREALTRQGAIII